MSRLRKAARWIGKVVLWIGGAFIVLAAITVFATWIWVSGFFLRTHDQSVLKAIKAESQILMAGQPTKPYSEVPKARWPHTIASLKPASEVPKTRWPHTIASLKPAWVTVRPDHGVDIQITPFFDGGWGYFVPRNAQEPSPGSWCSEIGQGVYWCHPY